MAEELGVRQTRYVLIDNNQCPLFNYGYKVYLGYFA